MASAIISTNTQVTALKGVTPVMAACLARLRLVTLLDLLCHLPLRYQDRTKITPIKKLVVGYEAYIEGEIIEGLAKKRFGKRHAVLLNDGTGLLEIIFFNQFPGIQRFQKGAWLRCYGEVRIGRRGLEMAHPICQFVKAPNVLPCAKTLTPVYPLTQGLTQTRLHKLTLQALEVLRDEQASSLHQAKALNWWQAFAVIHAPTSVAEGRDLLNRTHPAFECLVFEELLAEQLLAATRKQTAQTEKALPIEIVPGLLKPLHSQLPFQLTVAQKRVIKEILKDLSRPQPMQRLVQGDVGSGKTVVAACAAYAVMRAGGQVALMAPTELLAEQHYQTWQRWFASLGVPVVLLTQKMTTKERREVLAQLLQVGPMVAIGTHALFQDKVQFSELRLVIVDEQHRFGVHQRLALRQKGATQGGMPHQLIMTATPIPRTLAMTTYADLDISTIDMLPPGRTPVQTVAISNTRRSEVINRIRVACKEGRQVYWVCPLIEPSELLNAQAAEKIYQSLQVALPNLTIGLVHGRLSSTQKQKAMSAFVNNQLQVLVATTVIEVGVDVPNASLMIIENAEKLGLAQLHQLRGRVGRGVVASHCVLLYQGPLSPMAHARLETLRSTQDGFLIAEKDLSLRGAGEVLGTRQTGEASYKVADLFQDAGLLPQVKAKVVQLTTENTALCDALVERWFAGRAQYAGV